MTSTTNTSASNQAAAAKPQTAKVKPTEKQKALTNAAPANAPKPSVNQKKPTNDHADTRKSNDHGTPMSSGQPKVSSDAAQKALNAANPTSTTKKDKRETQQTDARDQRKPTEKEKAVSTITNAPAKDKNRQTAVKDTALRSKPSENATVARPGSRQGNAVQSRPGSRQGSTAPVRPGSRQGNAAQSRLGTPDTRPRAQGTNGGKRHTRPWPNGPPHVIGMEGFPGFKRKQRR